MNRLRVRAVLILLATILGSAWFVWGYGFDLPGSRTASQPAAQPLRAQHVDPEG